MSPRPRIARLVAPIGMLLSALLLAGAVGASAGDGAPGLGLGIALATAAALAAALAARAATRVAVPRAIRLGHRAREHVESLDEQARPAHPGTAGRARPRAPGAR
ncbi:hypothetical protein [Homoserinibacter sp. YIM 151385]|uniref:hypothetical protein n=1 Tax=Homoserinibacter sp. YIM 151385 TaxID=2985506 RepID=UPI0022F0C4D0|nr:hypothetical protein [Homoserinibacter sp. YIM 151385]WBU39115.1 hypothetical protein OF852_05940 [Homoserinibacter sp. YIM 151385]